MQLPIFLSVVFVLRDRADRLEGWLREATRALGELVSDYELIVVDNASEDASLEMLRALTGRDGLPNLQVYALSKPVDGDTAAWVGLENALGDFVAVVDPQTDDLGFLPAMLDSALAGADVVYAKNRRKRPQSFAYRVGSWAFHRLYLWFNGIDLEREAPQYRVLSKRVIHFLLQHAQPSLSYRSLPAIGGFARANLVYDTPLRSPRTKRIGDGVDRGMRMLVSSTHGPMRVVTTLSMFGAVSNVVYSGYVVLIALLKQDVAPGWVTLSLQQSGMFFLLSLVLWVLGEYILAMARLSNEGPRYYVAQEFTSARLTRRERLNVEDASAAGTARRERAAGAGA
jgi:hypothetical protein